MDPVTASLIIGGIGAAAGAGGSMFGSAQSAKAQRQTNQMNLDIAREQMAFQREGMQNRHQWEVKDLLAAGLNPILSANSGGPIGMGASATMINPKPNRGELMLASAKAVSDIILTQQLAKTEGTKQELNRVEKNRIEGGEFSNPLVGRIPLRTLISRAGNLFAGGVSSGSAIAQNIYQSAKNLNKNMKPQYG